MAMQGFETVIDGDKKAKRETRQKEARRIRKIRREAGNTISYIPVSAKRSDINDGETSDHASQLIHAIHQIRTPKAGDSHGNATESVEESSNSDLANMHLKITQASHMSAKAKRRRASVIFLPKVGRRRSTNRTEAVGYL